MYGFVHNDVGHLITNVITQLLVGLPLELSHSSWRVALVYLFGIMYGGLGREVFNDSNVPLAGASGKTFTMALHSESLELILYPIYQSLVLNTVILINIFNRWCFCIDCCTFVSFVFELE